MATALTVRSGRGATEVGREGASGPAGQRLVNGTGVQVAVAFSGRAVFVLLHLYLKTEGPVWFHGVIL